MIMKIDKDLQKSIGIYKITNLINNDFYIGSTYDSFYFRYYKYRSSFLQAKEGKRRKDCPKLYNAFIKYGFENFIMEIVELIERKPSINDTRIIVTAKEEYYIQSLNPTYNICRYPTKGGVPNLGRKLSNEWKKRIGDGGRGKKHSKDVLEKITKNNKDGGCLYEVSSGGSSLILNTQEVLEMFSITKASLLTQMHRNKGLWIKKDYIIKRIKIQKKKIKVHFGSEIKIFNSFNECDRYLNMYRGYTSKLTLKNMLLLEKYNYEII